MNDRIRHGATTLCAGLIIGCALVVGVAATGEHRSEAVLRAFQRLHPCPSTGLTTGPCPGYIKDHVIALCDGGPDAVSNLQWQTVAAAHAKDRKECKSHVRLP